VARRDIAEVICAITNISAIQRLTNDFRFSDAALPRPTLEQPVVALFDIDLLANHTSQYTSPNHGELPGGWGLMAIGIAAPVARASVGDHVAEPISGRHRCGGGRGHCAGIRHRNHGRPFRSLLLPSGRALRGLPFPRCPDGTNASQFVNCSGAAGGMETTNAVTIVMTASLPSMRT
jgi:hypothetical protein